jgi:protein-disulfide isomerase
VNIQKLTIITAIVIGLATIGVIIYARTQTAPQTATGSPQTVSATLDYSGQPSRGDPDAPVRVAIFEDFLCPACQFFEQNVMPALERDFVDTGQAQVFFYNFQFLGPGSVTMGIAAECAFEQNADAFWEYKTILYRAQNSFTQQNVTSQRLADLAQNVGDLDASELRVCVDERRHEASVTADREVGVSIGIAGTPGVVVNGQIMQNGNNYDEIRAAIEAALADN